MWLPKIPGNFRFNRGDLVNLSAGLSLKTRAKSSSVNFGNPLGISVYVRLYCIYTQASLNQSPTSNK